jgi:hypothetical protein
LCTQNVTQRKASFELEKNGLQLSPYEIILAASEFLGRFIEPADLKVLKVLLSFHAWPSRLLTTHFLVAAANV